MPSIRKMTNRDDTTLSNELPPWEVRYSQRASPASVLPMSVFTWSHRTTVVHDVSRCTISGRPRKVMAQRLSNKVHMLSLEWLLANNPWRIASLTNSR